LYWEKFSLHASTPKIAIENMIDAFDKRKHVYQVSAVVVESQSQSTDIMKFLQSAIQSHFYTLNVLDSKKYSYYVHISSGDCKLRVYNGEPIEVKAKSKHARNKQLGIKHAEALLSRRDDKKWKKYLGSLSKKDDAADCLLQGAFFILQQQQPGKQDISNLILTRFPPSQISS
jgi:hypothetical protein